MLQRAVAEYLLRVDRVQQLVLLRTGLGRAQALCVTIDDAHLPEVVGTGVLGCTAPGFAGSPGRAPAP